MKLTVLKGIAHDLADNLRERILFLDLKDFPKEKTAHVLEQKDGFEKDCVDFSKWVSYPVARYCFLHPL